MFHDGESDTTSPTMWCLVRVVSCRRHVHRRRWSVIVTIVRCCRPSCRRRRCRCVVGVGVGCRCVSVRVLPVQMLVARHRQGVGAARHCSPLALLSLLFALSLLLPFAPRILDFGQFDFGQLAELEVEIGRSRNWPKWNRWCLLFSFFLFFSAFSFSFSSSSFCPVLHFLFHYFSVFVPKTFAPNPEPQNPNPKTQTLRWTPLRLTAQNFALFSLSRHNFHSFFSLSWGSSRAILVVFLKAGELKCARLLWGPPGLHTTAPLQTRTFEGPGASNTTKIQREDTQRETTRAKMGAGEGKKKTRNFGLPRPSGPPPFVAPPFVVQKFNVQKPAEVEIGQSRNWLNSKKSRPKSTVLFCPLPFLPSLPFFGPLSFFFDSPFCASEFVTPPKRTLTPNV